MKKCAYCGCENEDNAVNCRGCGTPQSTANPVASPGTCDRCGAATDVVESFFKERKSFQNSVRTLCPACWQKHKTSSYKGILIRRLALGVLGLASLYLWPNHGMGFVLLNLFFFQIALILSILPHELAHAYVAKKIGWRVFKIYVGFGKTLFKRNLFGFETEFRAIPLGGLVLAAPRDKSHFRPKLFAFALAGPVANVLLLLGSSIAVRTSPEGFVSLGHQCAPLEMFVFANLVIVIENLLPRIFVTPLGQLASDGKQLLQALRKDPDRAAQSHAGGFILEGAVCYEKGQYEVARSWFEKGLLEYPDNIQLLLWNGNSLLALQSFEKARNAYVALLPRVQAERSLRPIILNNIAYVNAVLATSELLVEADNYSEQAMKTLAWHPSIRGTRGAVLLELGKFEEAMPLLRQAMQEHETRNNKAQNACWLAIAEAKRGNLGAGKKLLDEARTLDSTCFLLDRAETVLAGLTMRAQ